EAEEGLLEGRPLGINQTMLETGAKDSPADQREIAVVGNRSQLIGAGRLRQQRLQGRRRAEAVQAVLIQPFVVTHASSIRSEKQQRHRVPASRPPRKPADQDSATQTL